MGELVDRDQEHLRLLKIGFYIMAGMGAFFSLFSLLYIFMGSMFASGAFPPPQPNTPDMRFMGTFFLGMGIGFLVVGLTIALLTYLAGKNMGARRHRIFCIVVSAIWCMWVPVGTVLGVSAIMVLNRPSVRELFEGPSVIPPA